VLIQWLPNFEVVVKEPPVVAEYNPPVSAYELFNLCRDTAELSCKKSKVAVLDNPLHTLLPAVLSKHTYWVPNVLFIQMCPVLDGLVDDVGFTVDTVVSVKSANDAAIPVKLAPSIAGKAPVSLLAATSATSALTIVPSAMFAEVIPEPEIVIAIR
jgi:hypothetical protein